MHFSTGDCASNNGGMPQVKDPQIISRTGLGLGLMRLNSSSSCASLEHHHRGGPNSLRNSRGNLDNDG